MLSEALPSPTGRYGEISWYHLEGHRQKILKHLKAYIIARRNYVDAFDLLRDDPYNLRKRFRKENPAIY